MKVLLAVCSHEYQHFGSVRSVYRLKTRPGDELLDEWRFRGDVARESFVDALLQNNSYDDEDALLLLDGDQRHPDDMLERLRDDMDAHGFDMLCAHYYARQTHSVHSLCYPIGDGTFPFMPYLEPPTEGFHELGWAGFGSVLIKKKVLKAVGTLYPRGASPIGIGPLPEVTGNHDNVGPDLRFFWNARKLGYKLWLDAQVESLHGVTIWLGHKSARKLIDYTDWADAFYDLLYERIRLHGMTLEAINQRLKLLEARRKGLLIQAEDVKGKPEKVNDLREISLAVYELDGRIKENAFWKECLEKYPPITRPDQLPTTATWGSEAPTESAAELKEVRRDMYRDQATELAKELPNVQP